MAIDRREDAGEFYPGGKTISTQPVKGGGDMKHEDFADVAKLPDRFNDTMIHDKLNEVIGLLKGPVAAFALTVALDVLLGAFSVQGAGVTVETAPKGEVFNDEQIVTNVVFDATGLATPEMVTNIVQDVSPVPDFSPSNATLVATIEATAPAPGNYAAVSNAAMTASAAVSNKADAVRVAVDDWAVVACAWWDGDKLLTWNGSEWVWSAGLLGGARSLSCDDGLWEYTPSVTPFAYTNAVPIYGLPPSLVLYKGGDSVTLTRTNEVYGVATNAYPVAYLDDVASATNYTDSATNSLSASLSSQLSRVSQSATNYTDSATNGLLRTETDPTVPSWAKAPSKPTYTASEVGAVPTSRTVNGKALSANISLTASDVGAASASDVTAIAATLNAENARFVSTNYNSATHIPSAYVQAKIDGSWLEIWNELTRWNWLTDTYLPANFYTKGQINSALDDKADRAWGFYDSHSGLYAPEGFTWVSSPKIAIAGGLAYSRTLTAEGAIWVLEANGMVAETGGLTNGFFRVSDDEGNALFEIVKGDKRTVGAQADSVQIVGAFVPTKLQIGYAVQAETHPTLQITASLADPDWYDEDSASCPANVTWSGVSGAYVATVQAKSASATQLFVKAEYQVGGETYIKNVGPISVDGGILCTDGIHKVRPVYNNGNITWEVVQ